MTCVTVVPLICAVVARADNIVIESIHDVSAKTQSYDIGLAAVSYANERGRPLSWYEMIGRIWQIKRISAYTDEDAGPDQISYQLIVAPTGQNSDDKVTLILYGEPMTVEEVRAFLRSDEMP